MKIVALQAENIKKLIAVEIVPNGSIVELTGQNGAGKTSILDCISWALEGQGAIQGEPIRKGEKKAWVTLDLGDIIVKRTFRKSEAGETTSAISVESKEGAKFSSPQAMIDKLVGRLAFDPLAFARMKPREQFDELKRLVPGVDFEAIEAANKADFDKRTILNRKAKEAQTKADGIAASPDGPVEAIDESALLRAWEEAAAKNQDAVTRKANREAAAVKISEFRKESESSVIEGESVAKSIIDQAKTTAASLIKEAEEAMARAKDKSEALLKEAASKAEARIKAGRENALTLTMSADDLQKKLDAAPPLPEAVDLSAMRQEIDGARAENNTRLDRRSKARYRGEAEAAEKDAAKLTEAMEARENDKRAKVAAAKLPVEGMGFGDGVVTMGGVPFEQASDAEQLRASIAIAMSLNPKLRVIRVRDGSLLDQRSLELVAAMAKDQDYQVWIERVDSSGKVGFVIEDGRVKASVHA